MKRFWISIFASLAVLLGAGQFSHAQMMAPGGVFTSGGQAYMMVPSTGIAPVGYNADCTSGGCTSGGCTDGSCGQSGCSTCCEPQGWCGKGFAFGEFLYLRARNVEVPYAVVTNGPVVPGNSTLQISKVGLVDPDYQPGFRVGFGRYLDECSSISATYTMYEATTKDNISTLPPNRVVRSLVSHPAALQGNSDGLAARANYDINFDLVDIDYRGLFAYDCDYKLNYVAGVRFGQIEQQFNSTYGINDFGNVQTDIDFYGAGIRLGLEGERYTRRGMMVYGKTFLNLLAGEFHAKYDQFHNLNGTTHPVDTNWRAGRTVTMLDLELGAGWISRCGNWRLTGGYMFSSWMNMVTTDQYIKAVQTDNFNNSNNYPSTLVDLSKTISLDGFVARVEGRW